MNSPITNTKDLLKKSNLVAKFGRYITPASFLLLFLSIGIFLVVAKILIENLLK